MAKDSKTRSKPQGRTPKPSKRGPVGGRPPGPEEDRRSERLAFRIHPDLTAELAKVARENGEARSAWVERVVITLLNDLAGYRMLDSIGRYTDEHTANAGIESLDQRRPATVHPSQQVGARHPRPQWNPADRPVPASAPKKR